MRPLSAEEKGAFEFLREKMNEKSVGRFWSPGDFFGRVILSP